MCGIAGFARFDGTRLSGDREVAILRKLAQQIAHRGPDDEQIYFWTNVGFIFRRLSIVDPEGGRQPLFSEDQTVALICNGEIFNHQELRNRFARDHRFGSGSD